MAGYFKIVTVAGEVLSYIRAESEEAAKAAAVAGAEYLEFARAYTRKAACPLVAMAGLRVVPV